MKESKNNTKFVVLGLLAVSVMLLGYTIIRKQYRDTMYFASVNCCLVRYFYKKRKC